MKQIILHFFKSLAGRIAGVVFVALLLVGGWIALQYFNINLFGFKFGRELKIDKTANVIEKIDSPVLPNGELTMTLISTEPVPGPFTGIEYCTPD